jgi:hypothetical protein
MQMGAYASADVLRMRIVVAVSLLFLTSARSWAAYSPALARADSLLAIQACREAAFSQGRAIGRAVQSKNLTDIKNVLGAALKEWRATALTSPTYPAKAFCIHELIPASLPKGSGAVDEAKRFEVLGVVYVYYEPDDAYLLRGNPVDLAQLAITCIRSPWGQQAFLMMTRLGWSQGACQEGPDQFKAVIAHGHEFLKRFPDSAVAPAIRLEVAKAYTTWWNLSQHLRDRYVNPDAYKAGAETARRKAIELYLNPRMKALADHTVPERVRALRSRSSTNTYDYFCADYED